MGGVPTRAASTPRTSAPRSCSPGEWLNGAPGVIDDVNPVATQHGDEPTVVESVVAAEGVDDLLKGTRTDCIAAGDIPAAELPADCLPDAEDGRFSVVAHRCALDNAEEHTPVAEEDGPHANR